MQVRVKQSDSKYKSASSLLIITAQRRQKVLLFRAVPTVWLIGRSLLSIRLFQMFCRSLWQHLETLKVRGHRLKDSYLYGQGEKADLASVSALSSSDIAVACDPTQTFSPLFVRVV